MVKLTWEHFEQVLMEEQDERKEGVLVVVDSVLEEDEEWGEQHPQAPQNQQQQKGHLGLGPQDETILQAD